MNLESLIGIDINSALDKLKTYRKKIVVKDNNSRVADFNKTSVVKITEHEDYIEIITSNFKFL